MGAASNLNVISVEDYLAGELVSRIKHEYLAGVVYAMAGVRNAHAIIAGNAFAALHARLRGRKCQPFGSDTKIRVLLPTHVRFYYPDASVVCDANPQGDSYQDRPVVIFEVLSRSTRRVDEGEKKDAYLTIPSLCVYALVEQETAAVVVHRRTDHGFVREVYEGLGSVIPLPEINAELPLADLYERVEFQPEATEDDA
jgi:Uma2 family endonuclease